MNQGSSYTSPYEGYEASASVSGGQSGNLMYLVAGGLIGAAAALLLAPKSGSELRGDVADAARRGYDGALDLGNKVKEQTSGLYGTLREKGGSLMGSGSDALGTGQNAIEGALDADGTGNSSTGQDDLLSLGGGDLDDRRTNH
jgi:gas vesicle protein